MTELVLVDKVLGTAVAKGGVVDWVAVKTLCAFVQENPKAAKPVVTAIVTKIKDPGPALGMAEVSSLVLQALVKNGGPPVHKVVGKNKFLNDLIRIISPKFGLNVSQQVRIGLLAAMISWAVCAEGWATNVNPAIQTLAEAGVTVPTGYNMAEVKVPAGEAFRDIADPLEGAAARIAQSVAAEAGRNRSSSSGGDLLNFSNDSGVTTSSVGASGGIDDLLGLAGPGNTIVGLEPRLPASAQIYEGEMQSDIYPNGPVLLRPPTFHEGYLLIGKSETEDLLMRNKVGSYLVRESSTAKGSFALAVRDTESVQHFRIEENGGYLSITGSKNKFKQLDELVEFYRGPGRDAALPVQLTGTGIYGNYRMYKEPLHESRGYDFKADSYDVEDTSSPSPGTKPSEKETSFGEETKGTDEWEIERKDLTLVEVLGNGNYGEVHRALLKVPWGGEIPVAVKMAKADRMTSRSFFNEAKKLKQLQHKHIVRVYGLCTTDNPIFIVFEYMPAGSLIDFLESRKGKSLTLLSQTRMACDVAEGMAFLEKSHWVHADLAARNLLVGDKNVVKICDFGHAVKMDAENTPVKNPVNLPIRWSAPEFFLDSECSSASDMWSFGVVLYEILTKGDKPYKEMDDPQNGFNNKTLMAMLHSGWRMSRHSKVPKYFYGMMLDCWQAERQNRPSFSYIADVLSTLCNADKLRDVGGNWGAGLADASGRPLPDYRSVGPRYKPLSWSSARSDAAKLLLAWTKERETNMNRRDKEMMASLKGTGGAVAANA